MYLREYKNYMKNKLFCKNADKPCRTKENAEEKANTSSEYRRAYKCEFCEYWHISSRLKHEDVVTQERQEIDID